MQERKETESKDVMFSRIGRFKQVAVFAGFALSLLAAGVAPMAGVNHVEAAKKKAPNIAIQSISFEDGSKPGHRTVVVEVENVGNRKASGFRLEMVAQDHEGDERNPEYSDPLVIPKGGSLEVEFELPCGWLHNGAVTVTTDPNPVPNETKVANNTLTQEHGICILQIPL